MVICAYLLKKIKKQIEIFFSTNQILNDKIFFLKKKNLQKEEKKTEIVGENA